MHTLVSCIDNKLIKKNVPWIIFLTFFDLYFLLILKFLCV